MAQAKATETATVTKPATATDLGKIAELYHVPMSQGTIDDIAKDGVTPEKSKAFEEYIKTTAHGLYPTLAPQIAAGIPTSYLLDPYRQVAKQKLGTEFEPNFQTDPKAIAALTGSTDPKTGRAAPMSLEEWKQHIMTHPGFEYDKTPEAIARAHEVMQGLQQGFSQSGGNA